jgi:hypothetical protein
MTQPANIVEHREQRASAQTVSESFADWAERPAPLANDLWIYRLAITVLGILALLALGGSLALSAFGREAPQVAVALGSAAVGALAGLLTPPRG